MRLATPAVKASQRTTGERPGRRIRAPHLILLGYLLGALYVTAPLWVDPHGLTQNGDLHDVDQMTWFMRYAEQAVAHFHLPALVTSAQNAPHTVNLMWNTSILLPGVVMSPVTALVGPQTSLNLLLVLGFAGSAASLYLVLRRWGASITSAGLGGAVYGFSPAMIGSGIGHYHLVLAMLPPLMIDAVLRIVTGRGSAIRNGLWLGALAAAQLFIGEEALIDTCIAAAVLLIVLAIAKRRAVVASLRRSATGLGAAAVVALVLGGRALWVQFHGVSLGSGAYNVVSHHHHLTHLYTIPYAWVVPSAHVLLHTPGSAAIAANYPQPEPEYLAYLGIPLIIALLAAGVYFWRLLRVRVPFLVFALLELLSLGGQPIGPYPGKLLPWYWLQGLPVLRSTLPDRLSILADGAAAAVLAFAFDEALRRWRARQTGPADLLWREPTVVSAAIVLVALLPLAPTPYAAATVPSVPAGYHVTFTDLHLPPDASVLMVPVASGSVTDPMRWYGETGLPARMIGGDFIDASAKGRASRSGRAGAGCTPLGRYLDTLWDNTGAAICSGRPVTTPTRTEVEQQIAAWGPAAIVADTTATSPLGRFLISELGPPTVHVKSMLAWRLKAPGQIASQSSG